TGGPLFGWASGERNSGKSTLARIISTVICGHEPARPDEATSQEEMKKVLSAILMEAHPVICFENIEKKIDNQFLAKCLTESPVHPRILGQSKVKEIEPNRIFMATGNNISISSDLAAERCVIGTLDRR